MTRYTLSNITFGIPVTQGFEAPSDHDALWFSRGFIAAFIGRDPPTYIGSRYRLDLTPKNGMFDDTTQLGECLVEEIDGDMVQSWQTRRRHSSGPDMNVGDPHDERLPTWVAKSDDGRIVRKRSAASRSPISSP